jgi:hypothetical protein
VAKRYLKSWFMVDLISAIPFGFLNNLVYKDSAVPLLQLPRLLKLVKCRNFIVKYLRTLFNVGDKVERLFFFTLIFLSFIHLFTCLWIFTAKQNVSDDDWIYQEGYEGLSNPKLYMASVYFTVTTITTVGYGDISGQNPYEQLFCVVLMLLGVISFSFSTGSLSSILSSYDSSQANFKRKLAILNTI